MDGRGMIHGHHVTYSRERCRCEPCKSAHSKYARERLSAKKRGEPYSRDAGPAREHLRDLLGAGLRPSEIQKAAGISDPTMKNILDNSDALIYRHTEAAILSTTIQDVQAVMREVPSREYARMIRELTALGWGAGDIAQAGGVSRQTVLDTRDRPRERLQRDTALQIAAAYRQLVRLPRPQGRYADHYRRKARANRWRPPAQSTREEAA